HDGGWFVERQREREGRRRYYRNRKRRLAGEAAQRRTALRQRAHDGERGRRNPRSAQEAVVQSGSRSRATHPAAPARLSNARVPPCASAIWRDKTRPIPEPCGLVVKKGTNRLVP